MFLRKIKQGQGTRQCQTVRGLSSKTALAQGSAEVVEQACGYLGRHTCKQPGLEYNRDRKATKWSGLGKGNNYRRWHQSQIIGDLMAKIKDLGVYLRRKRVTYMTYIQEIHSSSVRRLEWWGGMAEAGRWLGKKWSGHGPEWAVDRMRHPVS